MFGTWHISHACIQVKTDQHMAKVKEQLMFEQRSIEEAEER